MATTTTVPAPARGTGPRAPHLLDVPHHDGSELYAPQDVPALGDVVPVRLRVPAGTPERGVWVRTRLRVSQHQRADPVGVSAQHGHRDVAAE